MHRAAALLMTSLFVAPVSGCGEQASSSPAPATKNVEDARAPAKKATASKGEERAFAELYAAARKRLAADKAVVGNTLGYRQALERQGQFVERSKMDARMPKAPPTADALRPALDKLADAHGLKLARLDVGAPSKPRAAPKTWGEQGPFPWKTAHLIGEVAVTMTLTPAEPKAVRRFYSGLAGAVGPVFDPTAHRTAGGQAVLEGKMYFQHEVTPFARLVKPLTLDALAAQVGVAVPTNHPRLAKVRKLVAEHAALTDGLREAMEVLDATHLVGARFAFYKATVKRLEGRPLPAPESP